jgi:hypothetical protein
MSDKQVADHAGSSVAVLSEREFAEWLNDHRDADVSSVFHEIVTKYGAALAAPSVAQTGGEAAVIVSVGQLSEPFTLSAVTTASANESECRKTCNICQDENGNPWPCAREKVKRRPTAHSRDTLQIKKWQDRYAELGSAPNELVAERRKGACRDAEITDLRAVIVQAPWPAKGCEPVASVVSRVGDDFRVGWLRPELCEVGTLLFAAPQKERTK